MVTVEIHGGLVGGREERGGNVLTAEPPDHCTRVKGPIANLEEIVVGLSGKVEELNVGS